MIHRLERTLEANRRLQARLVGILEAVDGAIWDNAQAQAALARNSALHPRAGRYRGMRGVLKTELLPPQDGQGDVRGWIRRGSECGTWLMLLAALPSGRV